VNKPRIKLSASPDETYALARRILAKLEWPIKPTAVVEVSPLTADEQKQFTAGSDIYKNPTIRFVTTSSPTFFRPPVGGSIREYASPAFPVL
jgi:hypothetical protein